MSYPGQDSALVAAAVGGDDLALDRLVRECMPEVLNWCARLGGAKVDSEDAAHDVLGVVITRLGTLRAAETFPYWLFGITRNVVRSHRRKSFLRRWIPGPVPDIADRGPGVGRLAELSETSRHIGRVMNRLNARQREVLVLLDLEERSSSEVAVLLDIPIGTVKSRIRLARAAFLKAAEELELAPDRVEAGVGAR